MRARLQTASVAVALAALWLGSPLTSAKAADWIPAESINSLSGLGFPLSSADCRVVRHPFGDCSDAAAGSDDIVTGSVSRSGPDQALQPLVEQVRARLLQSGPATE